MDEVFHLFLTVEVVVGPTGSRSRRRRQGRSRRHRVVDRKRRRGARRRRGSRFFQAVGARVDLRSGFGFHGGDGDEAAAAVEVVLYGARDEERVDAVDDAVGSGQ